MRARLIPIALLFSLFAPLFASAGPAEENLFLEGELKLAKKPNIYFVFDLEENKILLKARGAALKEMAIEGTSLWGDPARTEPLKLIKKSALLKPKRKEIKPQKEEEAGEEAGEEEEAPSSDAFEIEALELKDMPSSYSLILTEGVRVTVRPKPEGFFSMLVDIGRRLLWYVARPLQSAWNALWGRPFTALEIEISKEDAKGLYWAFPEGTEAIIYNPKGPK